MINKKKICLILMVAALSACNITCAQEQQETEEPVAKQENIKINKDTLDKAQSAIDQKDYQSAISILTSYIASKPKKYEAYKLRGEAFYALRRYRLAQEDFQTAIDLKAADDKFMTGTKYFSAAVLGADKQEQLQNPELGNLYGSLMYAQKALNDPAYETSYEKALEYNSHIYLPKPKKDDITKINCPQKYGKVLNPQGVDAEIASVIDDIESGKFNEALYKIPSITSNYPKYYLGYYLNGVALAGMEQDNEAITSFETALKYNPYDFESLAGIGKVYYSRAERKFSADDAQKSVEYFQRALKYNPNCNTYYFYIGLNELLMKDYYSAVSNFNTAVKNKTNDYNSMYYKLIAQYMGGDYKSVEENSAKLLYKRVSNYNSVLYLRALAKYKQGLGYDALADLEKIQVNMDDIYNADIKNLSEKEQILKSYIYYLKSEILTSKGFGAKTDLQKACENPVIANIVSQKSEFTVPAEQLDKQFDYIRTTFSDLNPVYEYSNPDYKLSISKTPVSVSDEAAADSSPQISDNPFINAALPADNIEQPYTAKEVKTETAVSAPVTEFKQSTESYETLADETKLSIAQVLASGSLYDTQNIPPEAEAENVVNVLPPDTQPQETVQTIVNLPEPEKISEESEMPQNITPDAKEDFIADASKPFVIEASEKRESPEFTIKYENPKIEETLFDTANLKENGGIILNSDKSASDDTEDLTSENSNTKPVDNTPVEYGSKPAYVIAEKHADVDLKQFSIPKTTPDIRDDDEVIVFEPQKTIFNQAAASQQRELSEYTAKIQNMHEGTSSLNVQIQEKIIEESAPEKDVEQRVQESSLLVPEIAGLSQKKPVETTVSSSAQSYPEPMEELGQVMNDDDITTGHENANEVIEIPKPDYNSEIKEPAEDVLPAEKSVKEKKRKIKKEKVKKGKAEDIESGGVLESFSSSENTAKEPSEGQTAISSILNSVFYGDDENKKITEADAQEDSYLSETEQVKFLEQGKSVKEKKNWFRKKDKPEEVQTSDTEQNINDDLLTPAITIINPEKKTPWYKKLFKKNSKKSEADDEEVPKTAGQSAEHDVQ